MHLFIGEDYDITVSDKPEVLEQQKAAGFIIVDLDTRMFFNYEALEFQPIEEQQLYIDEAVDPEAVVELEDEDDGERTNLTGEDL